MLVSRYVKRCTLSRMLRLLISRQAEFSYKLKPKLPQQFKAAESGKVPFAVILGEDELAAGKVKVKEMGLEDGHPEKDGVLVDLASVASEVKSRLEGKRGTLVSKGAEDDVAEKVEGLKVDA